MVRHSFITWLAVRKILTTKDRLASWGLNIDPICVFCLTHHETHDHLFFSFPYSAMIWY